MPLSYEDIVSALNSVEKKDEVLKREGLTEDEFQEHVNTVLMSGCASDTWDVDCAPVVV